MKQADRLTDPAARRSFLQNVPHNREIMAAWARRGAAQALKAAAAPAT